MAGLITFVIMGFFELKTWGGLSLGTVKGIRALIAKAFGQDIVTYYVASPSEVRVLTAPLHARVVERQTRMV